MDTPVIVSSIPISENPKSPQIIFWLTLILSFLNIFNAYKAAVVLFILNESMSKAGLMPYLFITIMPVLLLVPIIPVVFGLILFICALKIRTGSPLGLKLIIIFTILSYLSFFALGGIAAYQVSKLSDPINNSSSVK